MPIQEKKRFRERLREYKPLIIILLIIGGLVYIEQKFWLGFSSETSMRLFMGFFFLFFGFFKTLDLKGFVMAYAEYDVVAKRSKLYAYLYPFIELTLGLLFLLNVYIFEANVATLIVMAISSIGVIQVVSNKKKIHCACLGTVVKLPMTTVTIIEDIGMGLMALIMLLINRGI